MLFWKLKISLALVMKIYLSASEKGRYLGVAGLVGSGRTELVNIIYGAVPKESGEIWIEGKKGYFHSPDQAIEYGIGLIPEDRKNHGCILNARCAALIFRFQSSIRLPKFFIVNSKAQKKTAALLHRQVQYQNPFHGTAGAEISPAEINRK